MKTRGAAIAAGFVGVLLLASCGSRGSRVRNGPPDGPKWVSFHENDFSARLEKNRLLLRMPFYCYARCKGKLDLKVKTLSGKVLARGRVALPVRMSPDMLLVFTGRSQERRSQAHVSDWVTRPGPPPES